MQGWLSSVGKKKMTSPTGVNEVRKGAISGELIRNHNAFADYDAFAENDALAQNDALAEDHAIAVNHAPTQSITPSPKR